MLIAVHRGGTLLILWSLRNDNDKIKKWHSLVLRGCHFFVKRIWFEIHLNLRPQGCYICPALISWVHRKSNDYKYAFRFYFISQINLYFLASKIHKKNESRLVQNGSISVCRAILFESNLEIPNGTS